MPDFYNPQASSELAAASPIVPLAHPTTEELPIAQPAVAPINAAYAIPASPQPAYAPPVVSTPVSPQPMVSPSTSESDIVGAPHHSDTESLARTKPNLLGWLGAILVLTALFMLAGAIGYMLGSAG